MLFFTRISVSFECEFKRYTLNHSDLLSNTLRFAIPYYKCRFDHGEKCQLGERFKKENEKFLELSTDACDEDSFFHTGRVHVHLNYNIQ